MSLFSNIPYNELPSLEEASARRQAPHVEELINGQIRDVFLRHGAHNAFTLYLQHRHHRVREGEMIVKLHGTAHLMGDDKIKDIETMGNKIVPSTWMGNDLSPMEFAIVPSSAHALVVSRDFANGLSNLLATNVCQGIFGIDTLADEDWAELTIGTSSVVVPSKGGESKDYIPVSFVFDDKRPGYRVHGKCGKDHKHTSKP